MEELPFQPSEETIKLMLTFEHLLNQAGKQAKHATHLAAKQVQAEQNVPLFGVLKQWIHALVGDVLRWTIERQDEGPEGIVGIPVEDAEALLATLKSLIKDVATIKEVVGEKGKAGRKVQELALKMTTQLKEVSEVIDDFAIEEALEDEDEDEDDEDEYEPLVEPDDEPLIEPEPGQEVANG